MQPHRAIELADQARYEAMQAADTRALEALLSPDFTYVHRNGLSETRDQYLRRLQAREVEYGRARREDVELRLHGDTAVMTGRLRMGLRFAGGRAPVELDNRFLAVWIKFEAGWQLVAWSSTAISPPHG